MPFKTLALVLLILCTACTSSPQKLYVGSGAKDGIFLIELKNDGSMKQLWRHKGIESAGFLALDKQNKRLYSTSSKPQQLRAFRIDDELKLEQISTIDTGVHAQAHLALSLDGQTLLCANYSSADVSIAPINKQGKFTTLKKISHRNFPPSPVVPRRKKAQARPHQICLGPDGKYIYVPDLGLDKIISYRRNKQGQWQTNKKTYVELPAGSGPRHMCFHSTGRFAYVINELGSTISLLYLQQDGALKLIESISSLPANFSAANSAADIHLHPNGRFLYASNRGHNSIAIFQVNESNGRLQLLGHQSTKGDWPRNFTLTANGKMLLVANQRSNDIYSFFIDSKSGLLHPSGHKLSLPEPMCLLKLPR